MLTKDTTANPQFVQTALQRGMALFGEGRLDSAEVMFALVADVPDQRAFVQHMRGLIADRLGKRDEAKRLLREAIELKPEVPSAYYNLGKILLDDSQPGGAAAAFAAALTLKPDTADHHFGLACAVDAAGLDDMAVDAYLDGLALQDEAPDAEIALARLLIRLERGDEAAARLDRALARTPDHPGLHFARALVSLDSGDWQAAWPDYRRRWAKEPALLPRWTGEDAAGRVLVLDPEPTAGDCLFYLRYLPDILARGARPVLRVPAGLLPLIAGLPGLERAETADAPLAGDLSVPLAALPALFATEAQAVPPPLPLQADPGRVAHWRGRLAGHFGAADGPLIGLCWRGEALPGAKAPSIPAEALALLAERGGVRIVGLAAGAGTPPLLGPAFFDPGLPSDKTYLAEAAALISALDLVVTVESAVAHLAGSLGRPAWILLAADADWRWSRHSETSPWYPEARLFRQTAQGDWDTPLNQVIGALRPEWPVQPRKRLPDMVLLDALFTEGCRHHVGETPERARRFYERVLAMDADHVNSLCNLGALEQSLGNGQAAQPLLERAVRLAPHLSAPRRILGEVLLNTDRSAEAIAHFRRAVETGPRDSAALAGLAMALHGIGEFEEAMTYFQRAVEHDRQQSPAFFLALGETLTRLDRLDGAEQALNHAVALAGRSVAAHCALGGVLLRLGRPADAANTFRIALETDPQHPAALRGLASAEAAQAGASH